jgi:excisionase family DNA binding protein
MENPFETIEIKLDKIIKLLGEIIPNKKELEIISVDKEVMDVNEVAKFLFISKSTLYQYVMNRKIPHFKLGKKLYFKKSDLLNWVQEGKVKTVTELQNEASAYIINKRKYKR